jgi:hypothetical protein
VKNPVRCVKPLSVGRFTLNALASDEAPLTLLSGASLDADADGRRQLRVQLTATQPDLLAYADDLLAAGSSLDDFLETQAFVLAARQLAHETTALVTGVDVGPYRVVSLIAHGGMGVVCRATDVRLHRDVALKMMAPIGVPDELRSSGFFVKPGSPRPSIIPMW